VVTRYQFRLPHSKGFIVLAVCALFARPGFAVVADSGCRGETAGESSAYYAAWRLLPAPTFLQCWT
jgi:hypothetical protein